jgi:hypothetical protein
MDEAHPACQSRQATPGIIEVFSDRVTKAEASKRIDELETTRLAVQVK